jgi:hypothetical protein
MGHGFVVAVLLGHPSTISEERNGWVRSSRRPDRAIFRLVGALLLGRLGSGGTGRAAFGKVAALVQYGHLS